MKERPIPYTDAMVRALIARLKKMTRRLVKHPKWAVPDSLEIGQDGKVYAVSRKSGCLAEVPCPYGVPGDRLWVRETLRHMGGGVSVYSADFAPTKATAWPWQRNFVPPMHCPRGLSRILLDVVSVRAEHLQDITESDAQAEGATWVDGGEEPGGWNHTGEDVAEFRTARFSFRHLWETINGPASWPSNPIVWVVEFKVVQP